MSCSATHEYRLIMALSLHPGSTARQLATLLGWPHTGTSARLGWMHGFAQVRRERVESDGRVGKGRIEYRYWLTDTAGVACVQSAPPIVPHWQAPDPSAKRCAALGAEADRLTELENAR